MSVKQWIFSFQYMTDSIVDYTPRLDVITYTGNLGDTESLRKAFHNASAVLHLASAIDARFQPDKKLLQEVNVKGRYK